jgi:hypothetical protein
MHSLLIVHPIGFRDDCLRLMHHKRQTGLMAYSYELHQLIDGLPGRDDAERLKQAIYAASRDQRDVRYVLLVGDASLIPVRYRRTPQIQGYNGSPYAQWFTAADLYYANLYLRHSGPGVADTASGLSTWDANGDGFYDDHHWKDDVFDWNPDKVDGCPDVAVGRVPAHTADQVRTYVDKVIAYETGPGAPARVVCLSDKAYEHPPTMMDRIVDDSGIAHEVPVQKVGFGYAASDVLPAGYVRGAPPLTANAARNGAFLVYLGHGSVNSWDYETEGDANLLGGGTVAGYRSGTLPFVVSVGCSTGDWAPNAPGDDNPPYQDSDGIIQFFTKVNSKPDNSGAWTVTDRPVGRPDLNRSWTVRDVNSPRVPVPPPAEYDFNQPSGSFALSWLFNAEGGGIAFCGETTVGPDDWGADFATGMFKAWAGPGTVLGDMWLAGGRSYWQMHRTVQDAIGAPRCYLTYMTLFGDPSLRLRLRSGALPPAPAVQQVWAGRWTAGWTSMLPLTVGGQPQLFSYKAASGAAAVDVFNAGGQGTTGVWTGSWPVGYTSVETFYLGGQPHLLAYNAATGAVAIHRVLSPSNQGTTELWHASWSTGWTAIVPLVLGGHPHLLEYKVSDGTVAIDRVDDNGLGTTELWRSTWTTGWTSLLAISIGGQPHLFSYKAGDGQVAIDRINEAGQGTTGVWTGNWTPGWSVIRSLGILGQLLEYKSADGTAAIDLLDRAGHGSSEIWRAIWKPGFTTVVPFSLQVGLPGRTALDFFALRYAVGTGEVSMAAIGTYRQQT